MFERLSIGLLSVAAIAAMLLYGARDTDTVGREAGAALVDEYCSACHNEIDRAGELAFEHLDLGRPALAAEPWEAVVRKLRTGMMPPAGEPRPERESLEALAAYLETRLDAAAEASPDPGAPALHRLNRNEYANAIRDLLELEVDVATLLPADDAADGFDNIAGVLTVSPSLIEAYVSAGMKISRRAVGDLTMLPKTIVYRAPAGFNQDAHVEGLPLGTRGGLVVRHDFPLDAEYEFQIGAGAGGGGRGGGAGSRTSLALNFDGEPVDISNPRRFRLRMPAGPVEIAAAVVDRSRGSGVSDYHSTASRSGGVTSIQIEGPFAAEGAGETPSRQRIFSCFPQSQPEEAPCAREILSRLASSAYRELLDPADPEVESLFAFYSEGRAEGGFEAGIQRALAMLLIDPRFLFRFEYEPDALAAGKAYRISDYDLASRLSFFLWSSIPDRTLLELAAENRLGDPAVLQAQVERMLGDPRAEALVENFAGQWLYLRTLADVEPEASEWDGNLRAAFRQETELLFRTIMDEDRSILELIDADYTFVNDRLAEHYGIDGIKGSYFRRIELAEDSPRRGILGHGSLLTVTSVANRTSPVVRGAWILENLVGAPPPSPPPGVESNLDDAAVAAVTSLRERLEQHRANPTCASCHAIMDPIGLALENFDHIGAWRTEDVGRPIDATGVLADGTELDGPIALRQALLDRSDAFVTVATEKLMTYALGRAVEYYDMPAIRGILRDAAAHDYRFSALVSGIVTSVPFQMRVKMPAEDSAEPQADRPQG
jgi:mono/diheme cytochrome c family protein